MKVINFDAHFDETLSKWMDENASRYAKPEDMEEDMPEVYEKWLETPAAWLRDKAPGHYFDECEKAGELCELLIQYIRQEVPVPDMLLDRLFELGDENALMALLTNKQVPDEARMCAIELLRQMESKAPMVDYIRWQVERTESDELMDNAIDSLRGMGQDAIRPCKMAFMAAGDEGKEALLDVLADAPGDPDVFAFALNRFKTCREKRALYAGYLAKLNDDHALEALMDVAESDDVSYTDFIEIRSAIERLGAEAPVRDWSKDPSYQAFKRLQRAQKAHNH